ncbi:hypothetical protein F2Q69_00004178 [Brassica cretica]|uniref:Uncharacterized protein n=1 Tax=Brassica cretica TaxID=69181 RepID=A0A8S9NTG4_BRACR|nr:hypothetical protein F2Q69_00004178 [Brassica cretica]
MEPYSTKVSNLRRRRPLKLNGDLGKAGPESVANARDRDLGKAESSVHLIDVLRGENAPTVEAKTAPSILSLHSGQLQLAFPYQPARDPTSISSQDFNSNLFVLPFATNPSPRIDQHKTSSRPFQLVPVRVPARSNSRPFEVLLVVRFLQSANKR